MVVTGDRRFGMGKSYRVIRSIRETIRGSRAGQIEYSMVPPLATLRKISSSSISIMLSGSKSYVNKLWRRWVL